MAVRTTTLSRQGKLATSPRADLPGALGVFLYRTRRISFFIIFILYPLLQGLFLSFFKADLSPNRVFVGFDNYVRLLSDEAFLRAIRNTFLFVVVIVPLAMAISIGVAILIYPLPRHVQTFFAWPSICLVWPAASSCRWSGCGSISRPMAC